MNVSYDWLRAFVPFDAVGHGAARPHHRAHRDGRRARRAARRPRGRSSSRASSRKRRIPDSDHLHVTKVDAGTGTLLDVVCGAPNVTAGKLYPFAKSGVTLPGGLKIAEAKDSRRDLRRHALLGARARARRRSRTASWSSTSTSPPGTPLLERAAVRRRAPRRRRRRQPAGPALAPRRRARGRRGHARSRSRCRRSKGCRRRARRRDRRRARRSAGRCRVRIAEPDLVRRFMGVVIRGVKVGPSPEWLVRRLEAVGSRSINNVVDASNYVLHELGQPTHAFDLAKLGGSSDRRAPRARRARRSRRSTARSARCATT